MEVIVARAAALDVHKDTVTARVRIPGKADRRRTRTSRPSSLVQRRDDPSRGCQMQRDPSSKTCFRGRTTFVKALG